jgi:hypothetical protein
MEFVYKSERTNNKIQKICETNDLSDLKHIKIKKSPFMSNSKRSDFIYNVHYKKISM